MSASVVPSWPNPLIAELVPLGQAVGVYDGGDVRRQGLAHVDVAGDGGRTGGRAVLVLLLGSGSGYGKGHRQGSQDSAAQAPLGVGRGRQGVLTGGQRLAVQVAVPVPVQRVGRDVFRLVNVLASGEFQAHAADFRSSLHVGPDAVAAVVRVV